MAMSTSMLLVTFHSKHKDTAEIAMQTKTRNAVQTKPLDELMCDEEAQAMAEWRATLPATNVGQLMQEDEDQRTAARRTELAKYRPLCELLD